MSRVMLYSDLKGAEVSKAQHTRGVSNSSRTGFGAWKNAQNEFKSPRVRCA